MNVANGQGNVRKEFYTFKAEGHIWKSRATNLLICQVISCFIADYLSFSKESSHAKQEVPAATSQMQFLDCGNVREFCYTVKSCGKVLDAERSHDQTCCTIVLQGITWFMVPPSKAVLSNIYMCISQYQHLLNFNPIQYRYSLLTVYQSHGPKSLPLPKGAKIQRTTYSCRM